MKIGLKLAAATAALMFGGVCFAQGVTETSRELKLMSFNIRHGADKDNKMHLDATAAAIAAERPDFVGLQEVDVNAKRSGVVDEATELGRRMGLHATFAKAIPLQGGSYGVAVLSREKPLSVVRKPLPGKEPRVLLLCEFGDFWFGTTHLDLVEDMRLASVEIIRSAVCERAKDKPVILSGDWNARPNSAVMEKLREFLRVVSGEKCITFHGFAKPKPGDASREHCIDYIAVDRLQGGRVEVRDAHVVPDRVTSDHSPIVATVRLAPKDIRAFNLATFNMRTDCSEKLDRAWSNRCPRVAKIIRDHRLTLIGAQELKHNQVDDLRRALGPDGYEIVGRGRLKGGKGEGVYILYDASRFDCLTNATFQLSETPEVDGSSSWNSSCPRTCVWGRFRDKANGAEFLLFNTHLDHRSELARLNGMKLILERIKAATTDGTVAFLTGDMNNVYMPGNSIGLATEALKETSALSETPHAGSVATFHGYTPPARCQIDYIFVSKPVRIISHETIEDFPDGKVPTDHFPVAARVMLPGRCK